MEAALGRVHNHATGLLRELAMSDCHICGCEVEPGAGRRQRMKVGESRSMFRADWHYYYAEVLVCDDCGQIYDWRRRILLLLVGALGVACYYWFVA